MTMHPFRTRLTKLPAFALITLLACSSCALADKPGSSATPSPRERAERQAASKTKAQAAPAPVPFKRPANGRPDPRYRPPTNASELHSVAREVAKASGHQIRWRLAFGKNPGPLAIIRGTVDDCTIFVHPIAATKVPPNTWAFIIGHEFAHLTENLGTHSKTSPANELAADIAGARYAMAAGYRLEAFLGWVLTEPNQKTTQSHGSLEKRVQQIAARYGIPQNTIQAEAKKATKYRATH
jgi:hypothetical protein